jgi:type IV fimbrial biogenesis protein FimT
MKKSNGFTLVELMIVVAIVGILAMVAAPSFKVMLQNNRQATQINTLLGSLNLARSESIKRGLNVVLCRSNDGATCAAAGGWEQGWVIFVDADAGNDLDAGEEIIRVFGTLAGRTTLTPNNNFTNRVVYQPSGFSTQVGTFVHCSDRDSDGDVLDGDDFTLGGSIIINFTGRAHSDTAPNSTFANCAG